MVKSTLSGSHETAGAWAVTRSKNLPACACEGLGFSSLSYNSKALFIKAGRYDPKYRYFNIELTIIL